MTNVQIIAEFLEENQIDFNYNGENLCTFAEWKRQGMSVIKGQKAAFTIPLWTMKLEDEKDEKGKIVKDEKGKPKKVKKFYKKNAALFTADQVKANEAKPKRKKKNTFTKAA